MKKLLYILFLLVLTSLTNAQWVQVSNGMGSSKSVHSLAYSGNNIFAGTYSNGVYISTNNGTNWTNTSTELTNKQVYSLAINGNNLYAGTSTGVYLSTNNGTNWTQTSLNNQSVTALTTTGSNIFAGTQNNGVYLSTNNGSSWTQTSLNNQTIFTLTLAYNGSVIYAGAYSGLYISTNNGTIWYNMAAISNQDAYSIAIDGNKMFVGAYYGVYKSTDGGANWYLTSLDKNVLALAININNILAATRNDGFYISINNGTSWTQRNEGLGDLTGNAMCVFNNYIFLGTDASVYRRPQSEVIGIKPISTEIPSSYSLSQNYPNPFNPTTKIRFDIPSIVKSEKSNVKIIIYDALGREIAVLVNEQLQPGSYEVEWNALNYTSGVYFYTIRTEVYTETKRMVLIK